MERERESLLNELEQLGYFRFTAPDDVADIKRMFITGDGPFSEYPYVFDERTSRVAHVDAENVAKGWADDELGGMREVLSRFGVHLEAPEQPEDGQDYTLRVNGVTYLIASAEEMAEERKWYESTCRMMAIVNALLAAAGAEERAYLLYLGELSVALFLTPMMYEAIAHSPVFDEFERPHAIDSAPVRV